MTRYLIAATTLIVVTILIIDHIAQDREKEKRFTQSQNDLEQQLKQTTGRLERSEIARSTLNRSVDSILLIMANNNTKLAEKDREISKIKGRYQFVPVDSLSNLMERRANANR